jgi:hypothetical protein
VAARTDCQQHELNAKPRAQVRLPTQNIELDLALHLAGNQVENSGYRFPIPNQAATVSAKSHKPEEFDSKSGPDTPRTTSTFPNCKYDRYTSHRAFSRANGRTTRASSRSVFYIQAQIPRWTLNVDIPAAQAQPPNGDTSKTRDGDRQFIIDISGQK